MLYPVYTEVLKMIMKYINRIQASGGYAVGVPAYTGDSINPEIEIPTIPGFDEYDYSNPFKIAGFEGFDYHLMYNDQDELIGFTSHNGKIKYYLRKDIYDDLIYIDIYTPDIDFKIALIFQFYDLRFDTEYVEEKGLLTDVILLNANNQSLIIKLEISPKSREVELGDTAQYTCTATLFDGTVIDVTDVVNWEIGSPLTINEGKVTAEYSGTYQISATYQNLIDTVTLVVPSIELVIQPANVVINPRETAQYFVYLKKNGQLISLSNQLVEWSINSDTLQIDNGLVSNTIEFGTFTVTANYKGNTASATLEVRKPQLIIQPSSASINPGDTAKFRAYLKILGNMYEVTNSASWEIESPLTISAGLVSNTISASAGTYTVTCRYTQDELDLVATAQLTILESDLIIEPSSVTIDAGQLYQFRCYLITSESNQIDVTYSANWSVQSPLKINRGQVYDTTTTGNYTVTAEFNGKRATATVIINPPSLIIQPSTVTVKMGDTYQFRAYLKYAGGSYVDVSNEATWTVESPLQINKGLVTNTTREGTYKVTATHSGMNAQATIQVLPRTFALDPTHQVVFSGGTAKFDAYLDGYLLSPLAVQWSINVSELSIENGVVRTPPTFEGTAIITATYGSLVATATLEVQKGTLRIEPQTQVVKLGQGRTSFRAILRYPNGMEADVTKDCNWTIDPPCTIYKGRVENISRLGAYTVKATYPYNGITAEGTLLVVEEHIIVDTRNIKLWFKDGGSLVDGDSIRVKLNGVVVANQIDLTADWKTVSVTLNPGINQLELGAIYNGRYVTKGGLCTATVRITDANNRIIKDNLDLFIECPTTKDGQPLNPNLYYKLWTFGVS